MVVGDARTEMIDAAERLAAERGLGSMSLREVQKASGQRNKSAAQYHFGSRAGLIEAVVASRMGPINERRLEMLAALGSTPHLHEVVEVLVVPLAEATTQPGSCWARFLFQGWADPDLHAVVRRSFDATSYREVRSLLDTDLASLPAPIRARRIDHAVGLVLLALSALEAAAAAGSAIERASAESIADLVATCCGLLTASPPSTSIVSAGSRVRQA